MLLVLVRLLVVACGWVSVLVRRRLGAGVLVKVPLLPIRLVPEARDR